MDVLGGLTRPSFEAAPFVAVALVRLDMSSGVVDLFYFIFYSPLALVASEFGGGRKFLVIRRTLDRG